MERVAFLIEATGERVSCLLNPERLTFAREAGLRVRGGKGALLGTATGDDPLIATGGGKTELDLELLFDTDLARSLDPATALARPDTEAAALAEPDVRDLTRPLWNLAEAAEGAEPPVARFIWGRAWNMAAIVTAVAERLERFGTGGAPQRSWMSLRLRRVPDTVAPAETEPAAPDFNFDGVLLAGEPEEGAQYVQTIADTEGMSATPLYQVAADHMSGPQDWPLIAAASGIEDPLRIPPGTVLTIPSGAVS